MKSFISNRLALVVGLLVASLAPLVAACGHGAQACAIVDVTKTAIDAAEASCTVVRYLGPDGKTIEEHVPASEIAKLARVRTMFREAAAPPSASAGAGGCCGR